MEVFCCVTGEADFSPEPLPSGAEGNFEAAGHPGEVPFHVPLLPAHIQGLLPAPTGAGGLQTQTIGHSRVTPSTATCGTLLPWAQWQSQAQTTCTADSSSVPTKINEEKFVWFSTEAERDAVHIQTGAASKILFDFFFFLFLEEPL